MAIKVVDLECPGCGARVDTTMKSCKYCGGPIVISSFNDVFGMTSQEVMKYKNSYQDVLKNEPDSEEISSALGMCLLKLNMYDKAFEKFDEAILEDINNSETFFWAACSLLKGKRAFVASKEMIDKAIEYTTTATMIENRGIYYYFLSYLKYDYYHLKKLRVTPDYTKELENAKLNGVSNDDINMLSDVLKIKFSDDLSI